MVSDLQQPGQLHVSLGHRNFVSHLKQVGLNCECILHLFCRSIRNSQG